VLHEFHPSGPHCDPKVHEIGRCASGCVLYLTLFVACMCFCGLTQCLMNIPELTVMFTSGRYRKHLNAQNRLGTGVRSACSPCVGLS
jgi:hypothetical protein